MNARPNIQTTLDAVRADRRAARDAGNTELDQRLYELIEAPLRDQLAQRDPEPESDASKSALAIYDAGLTALSEHPSDLLSNTRGVAERIRSALSASAAHPTNYSPGPGDTPPADAPASPAPPHDNPIVNFVRARKHAHKAVVYIDGQGYELIRQGGSRSWRNNNPGNIRKGIFANVNDAIGDDNAFAIFPSERVGFSAIVSLFRTRVYRKLSLADAIYRYAPPSENNSSAYLDFVVSETEIGANTILGTLKVSDLRRLARAIRKMEGWQVGDEHPNLPASGIMVADATGGISSAIAAAHEWMSIAEREAALPERERSEWADPGENPRITEYFRASGSWCDSQGPLPVDDEINWCAAFVNYCLVESGYIGTAHPGARSFFWNEKRQFVSVDGPVRGCIGVYRYAPFDDHAWVHGRGHVGFVSSFSATHVTLLGGNQRDTVCHQEYSREKKDSDDKTVAKFVAFMIPVMN